MAMTVRWNETQTWDTWAHLSHSVMCKESNEDDTKETLQNIQTKGTHESSVGVLVRVHMLHVCVHVKHVVVLVALYAFVSSFQSSSMFPKNWLLPVLEFLVIVHTAKTGLLRCCLLHTPLVTVDRRQQVNDLSATKKKIVKAIRLRFYPKICRPRVAPFYHKSLHASSFMDFLWILRKTTRIHSIATKWRKNSMTVAVAGTSSMAWAWVVVLQILGVNGLVWTTLGFKSERFLNGPPVFPDLLREIPPILCVMKIFCVWHSTGEILFCKIVSFKTNIFISIMFKHTFAKIRISKETIMDPFDEMSLDASLFQIMDQMIFFLFWSFPISVAMRSSLLVFTEQGSSASQMTAAKIMDIISRLPGCAGQATDAVSVCNPGKHGRCSTNHWKSPNRNVPEIWTLLPKIQMAKIMVQYGRRSRSSWTESVRSSFSRTDMREAIGESSLGTQFVKSSKLGVNWEKGLFLSVHVDDIKTGREETEHKSDVEHSQWKTLNWEN